MNYQSCPAMDSYTALWMQFPGDDDLLAEIAAHKAVCKTCQENIAEFETRERERILNDKNRMD